MDGDLVKSLLAVVTLFGVPALVGAGIGWWIGSSWRAAGIGAGIGVLVILAALAVLVWVYAKAIGEWH
jgi:hypothetical protein